MPRPPGVSGARLVPAAARTVERQSLRSSRARSIVPHALAWTDGRRRHSLRDGSLRHADDAANSAFAVCDLRDLPNRLCSGALYTSLKEVAMRVSTAVLAIACLVTGFAVAGTRVKALEDVSPARFPSDITVGPVSRCRSGPVGTSPARLNGSMPGGSSVLPTSRTRSIRSSARCGMPSRTSLTCSRRTQRGSRPASASVGDDAFRREVTCVR